MNSKTVLSKIITLLSKQSVSLAYASLADGTVLESATFDVGETVEVVAEDGTKSAAPNGEHELFLKDDAGNELRIRIIVKDGVIAERENVEELEDAEVLPVNEKEVEMEETETETESEDVSINLADVAEAVSKMSYRIEELEKKLADMQVEEDVKEEEVMEEEEEELPKLDGAPLLASKVNVQRKAANVKQNRQSAFLSKLYK